ncbi:MAG: NADH-quinone oxidoreductase subunit D [Melioribacteraceae bacterium]|jgi:NADH-quinone oxidoreductase subunit D|nr:NADH-quinone oxidoreductase subunit D [Melioribacteraceae bacterium]
MSLKTESMILNMGPQHPSTHGVLRLELELEGELILNVRPHIGYLHRCFEKHAEALTYPQIIPYTDRMDYLASMYNNFGYVIAVEKLLGIQVPERVEYIRVIMGELQRIASHLVAVGTFGLDIGAFTPFLYLFRDREKILSLFEMTCGARLLYNYMWVGGLSHDIHPDFVRHTKEFLNYFKGTIVELNNLLSYNKIFIERTANIGVLPVDTAINFGASGPVLRGSGLAFDLRREDPYSIYDRFDFDIPVGKGLMGTVGDCWDRYWVRVLEMEQSIRIIEQAIDSIPEGDVQSAIPKRIKPPKGTVYTRVENPRGELGYFIISDGNLTPFRVKVRAPSFVNLEVLGELCKGHLVADVIAILGSIDIVLGEVDR